ncbi:uncharacterized protein LOC134528834 [Bacillus rossius redtenbacheri]|uniref:uncharacterized protein LOC134528834 n=1 Tax=Bacillus rossius redtenbacheri TaxID=93214 RepID=UPI002FDE91D5
MPGLPETDKLTRYSVAADEWTERVSGQFRGEAHAWWQQTGEYDMDWSDFTHRLESRFNDSRARARCQRELFCRAQTRGESVEAFVHEKLRLHRRLATGSRFGDMLSSIVELLTPELRPFLRGAAGESLDSFLTLARDIEEDLKAAQYTRGPQRDAAGPSRGGGSSQSAPSDLSWRQTGRAGGSARGRRAVGGKRGAGGGQTAGRRAPGHKLPEEPATELIHRLWHPSETRTPPAEQDQAPSDDGGDRARPEPNAPVPGSPSGQRSATPTPAASSPAVQEPDVSLRRPAAGGGAHRGDDTLVPELPAEPLLGSPRPDDMRLASEVGRVPVHLGRVGPEEPELLRIPVRADDREMLALVDTAASRSFVAAHLVAEEVVVPRLEQVQQAIRDTSTTARGTTQVTLNIIGHVSRIEAWVVPDLREGLILGAPWLHEVDAAVEVRAGRMHFGTRGRWTVYGIHQSPPPPPQSVTRLEDLRHNVPAEYADAISWALESRPQVFAAVDRLRRTTMTEHSIPMVPHRQPFESVHGFGPREHEAIQSQVDEMLRDGVIEPSTSPYNSRVVLATKKDGSLHFCVNFKAVNRLTIPAPPPQINITDALAGLGDAKMFTTLDLKSGYWKVPVCPADRPKTAFTAPDCRRYQFCAIPFGLMDAPATFQSMMVRVLDRYIGVFASAYLDDVIVYSGTWEDHAHHLALVLERLARHGLTCAPNKCHIKAEEIVFLGHLVTAEGCHPRPAQLELIEEKQAPKTRKQLQKLMGLLNWLRSFVPDFATITAPMTDLLSPKAKFRWTPAADKALRQVKDRFRNCHTLSRLKPDQPIFVQMDASQEGMGAVLYQVDGDGVRRVIEYPSAKFGPAERRYHVNEQECLAVVWALQCYRHHLEGRSFTLRTDSQCLRWLDSAQGWKSKFTRWAMLIQEFSFSVEHVPGRENQLADELSRNPDPTSVFRDDQGWEEVLPPIHEPVVENPGPRPCELYALPDPAVPEPDTPPETLADLLLRVRAEQLRDPDTQSRLAECGEKEVPGHRSLDGVLQTRGPHKSGRWRTHMPPEARQWALW